MGLFMGADRQMDGQIEGKSIVPSGVYIGRGLITTH